MTEAHQILIVDDEFQEGEMMSEYLKLTGDFAADLAINIREMWERLTHKNYDVILLDYNLPDGTGIEALREMPARGCRTPVIMVTGTGNEQIAARSIKVGAIDYLVKGENMLAFLPARIEKAIQDHKLQKSVEHSLERIRYQALLLNNVRDAVVVWDMQGVITYWNPAAERLFSLRAADMVGCQAEEAYFRLFNPPVRSPAPGHTSSLEIERSYEKGHSNVVWVSSRVSALRDYEAGGQFIGFMDVSRDISQRKKMAGEIKAAHAQLLQATRLAAIGELAAGVAHQIYNPLTTIIGESQILLQSLPPEHSSRKYAEAIEQAGWRTQRVVHQLLEFSQPASTSLETLSVNKTIEHALTLVEGNIRAVDVNLETHLNEDLFPIYGNARQLGDLWVNLLLMARDATSVPQKNLTICVHSKNGPRDTVVVEIQNNGKSISPEELEMVFEPNLSSPPQGHGTGMELSICREIVRQHKGHISVESDALRGTIFKVSFPREVEQ